MYGILCKVESCLHNYGDMCLSPEKVHLEEQKVLNTVVLNCDNYVDKDQKLLKKAEQDKVPSI